jgi:homopolymeric O-antigen transport system permease protein
MRVPTAAEGRFGEKWPQDTMNASMNTPWAVLGRNRELIWVLALKELRVRYRRSTLGFLWALLNPLMMMVILTVVFSKITRTNIPFYAVFLISALLPWTFFSQCLSYCADSVVGNGELLKKVKVEKVVFPMAAIVSNTVNFTFSLVPLVLILLVLRFPFHWTWIYLPVALMPLVLFATGCGMFFAAMNVFFRDVSHILQILLTGWFYLCPIIYPLDLLPPRYQRVLALNPLTQILEGFRAAIYDGHLPSNGSIAMAFGWGALALFVGFFVFRKQQDDFIYYV